MQISKSAGQLGLCYHSISWIACQNEEMDKQKIKVEPAISDEMERRR